MASGAPDGAEEATVNSGPRSEEWRKPGEQTAVPARGARRGKRLSFDLAFDLVLCGAVFAGLSLLARHVEPGLPRATWLTGLVGAGLCVFWGGLGRWIPHCRWGATVTLAVMAGVFGRQVVQSWGVAAGGEPKGGMAVALMGTMVVFSVGMLTNLVQAGKGRSDG